MHSIQHYVIKYHTFFSHVKARIQETVKNIDLRIGSDDESGLIKALESVIPEATSSKFQNHKRLLGNLINVKDRGHAHTANIYILTVEILL